MIEPRGEAQPDLQADHGRAPGFRMICAACSDTMTDEEAEETQAKKAG